MESSQKEKFNYNAIIWISVFVFDYIYTFGDNYQSFWYLHLVIHVFSV